MVFFERDIMLSKANGGKITVWTVCTGNKYDTGYVYALRDMVNKYLTYPHDFKCITEHYLSDINTVKPSLLTHSWWDKLNLFDKNINNDKSLFFDLDVVITKNIDYLVDYAECQLSAPANWAQSGHGGIQSSVMAWNGQWHTPFNAYNDDIKQRLWGDQEYLTELLGDNFTRLPHIGSYKYHCQQGLPDDLAILCFHGKPDPHEVSNPWILPYTRTLNTHIK